MKRRPESTTSERELIADLAAGGRALSLSTVAAWRRNGLLPPLESYGTGAGRTYYWRDPGIRKRAAAAFDLLERHCQVDMALWGLWLRGYPVPATRLRRVWRQCQRFRRAWLPSVAAAPQMPFHPATAPGGVLAHAAHFLAQTLPPDRRMLMLIERAMRKMQGAGGRFDGAAAAQLWALLQMAGLALETSALIDTANDAQLAAAQRHLGVAGVLLASCADEPEAWNEWLADRAGPSLALVILALLRSGQSEILDALAARVKAPDRPRPVRTPLYQITA